MVFGESTSISIGGLLGSGSNVELSFWWMEQGRNNKSGCRDSARVIPLAVSTDDRGGLPYPTHQSTVLPSNSSPQPPATINYNCSPFFPNPNPKSKQPPSEHGASTLLQATLRYLLILGSGVINVLENHDGAQFLSPPRRRSEE